MSLKAQLQAASEQLAELINDEIDDVTRFDVAYSIVARARELALNHHAADAIDIARRVTGELSPSEAQVVLAAMIQSLPNDPKELLNISDVTELLSVSPATVAEWIETGQLKAANLSKSQRPRWVIRRADYDRFLELRAAR